jgi:hypothetical protein
MHFLVLTAGQALGWVAWMLSRLSAACFYAASRMFAHASKQLEARMEGR